MRDIKINATCRGCLSHLTAEFTTDEDLLTFLCASCGVENAYRAIDWEKA